MEIKRLFVIDLMNIAFRAYYGLGSKQWLATSKGKPTFVTFGVALSLNRLFEEFSPDYIAVATDSKGRTFRHDMFDGYKSNRKEAPPDFSAQIPDVFRMLDAYGIQVLKYPATEADDVIGSVCKKFSSEFLQTVIVSGDKDYMQLVDNNVKLCKPINGGGYEILAEDAVMEKFSCHPSKVVDCLALIGDQVDMIPGVHGIGEKGAAKLMKSFGSLEAIYENIHLIPVKMAQKLVMGKYNAFLSKSLAQIKTDIPLYVSLDDLKMPEDVMSRPQLKEFFAEMEFQSLLMEGNDLVADAPVILGASEL